MNEFHQMLNGQKPFLSPSIQCWGIEMKYFSVFLFLAVCMCCNWCVCIIAIRIFIWLHCVCVLDECPATFAKLFPDSVYHKLLKLIYTWLRYLVLWHCWLDSKKVIWPVENWVVECWHGYLSRVRCRLAYGRFTKMQIGSTFLVLAHPGSTRPRAVKRVHMFVC